jgi:hypothetical protein
MLAVHKIRIRGEDETICSKQRSLFVYQQSTSASCEFSKDSVCKIEICLGENWKMDSIVKRWRHCRSSSCSRSFVTKDEGEVETRNKGKKLDSSVIKYIRWLWLN